MKFPLGRDARVLLLRLFFAILAISALYGLYDNRAFLIRFPFHLLAGVDLLFIGVFGFLAYNFKRIPKKSYKLALYALISYWFYSVAWTLISAAYYAINLGIGNVSQAVDMSVPQYIATEILYFGILPSAVYVFMWWVLRSVRD